MTLAKKTLGIRKNLKEEERREQFKKAAIKLFSASGYDQVSLDDLALEAGVSKALFYWYWKTKAALLCDLIDECMAPYLNLLKTAVDSNLPFMERMQSLLQECFILLHENENLNKVVHFCSLHNGKKVDEDFGVRVNQYYEKCLKRLETLLREGMEKGFIDKRYDVEAMSLETLCFIEGYIYMTILGSRMPFHRVFLPLFNAFIVNTKEK